MTNSQLDKWLQPQTASQEGEMDCGLAAFARLANVDREQLRKEMPEAVNGMTPVQGEAYLRSRGFKVMRCGPGEKHPMPCVHLVERTPGCYHWIFEAEDGGIYDSDPSCKHCPPDFIRENFHVLYQAKILTLAIE